MKGIYLNYDEQLNQYYLRCPYNPFFIANLLQLDYDMRRWDKTEKQWVINNGWITNDLTAIDYVTELLHIYY